MKNYVVLVDLDKIDLSKGDRLRITTTFADDGSIASVDQVQGHSRAGLCKRPTIWQRLTAWLRKSFSIPT